MHGFVRVAIPFVSLRLGNAETFTTTAASPPKHVCVHYAIAVHAHEVD
jgi:hypothetical protein